MENKDEDFWGELGRWDVICLIETWIEKKGWRKIEEKLSKEYIWEKQWARRRNKKGRALAGMLMRVKRGRDVKGE